MTTTAERVRGVLAALALLAFIAGVPCGLLALGAGPARLVPGRWPDPVPISQWPERIWNALRWAWLTGDLVLWLIIAVAWAGWLALTISVIVEVLRQTRHGVRAVRGLVGRVPRGRWIAGLVAAVVVASSAGTAVAANGPPAAPAAATAPPWPHPHPTAASRATAAGTGPDPAARADAPVAAAAPGDTVRYTVVHGDTLWGLAERHLGAGIRYHEIVRLNPTLHAPDDLQPGWTLRLPPDATGLLHLADTAVTGRTVTVQPADTLSGIAERELGDPDAWREIFDLNEGRTQPDGRVLRHPDRLLPGWTLVLPAEPPAPPAAPPDTPAPAAPPQAPPSAPAQELPTDPPVSLAQPAPPAPRGGQQHAPAVHIDTGVSLSTGAFVGLGLAALITLAMITVRLRRRRWYRPGSQDADPAGLPVVRALRIAHDAATRAPDEDGMLAASALPGWVRPAEMTTRDRARATTRAVLPAQGTPLGVRDGQAIALDLARTQGLGLVGPGAHAAARALIVTVLAHATDDGLHTVIVIPAADARTLFGHDLKDRAPQRLCIVEDLPAALDVLDTELLARTHEADVAWHDPPARAPLPRNGTVLVIAAPTPDTVRRADTILENGAHHGLAGMFLGPWQPGGTAHIRDDGTVETTSPTLKDNLSGARLFTLPGTDARDLLALLHAAEPGDDDPTRSPAGTTDDSATSQPSRAGNPATSTERGISEYEFIPAVPDNETAAPTVSAVLDTPALRPAATTTTAGHPPTRTSPATRLHLQVLGRLHLTRANADPRDLIDAFAPRQREILVYLALHRTGCRRETLTAALWPDAPGERPYNSFHATLSQLRRALRRTTGDDALDLIVLHDGRYGLDPTTVTIDLWQLQDALATSRGGPPADAIAALNRVTELYCADLAEGIAADWIDGPREALRRDVLDTLSTLVRRVRHDDPGHALALLEHARWLDPYNEAIYRDLMRTQARLGRHDSIPRTLHLLTTALAELDQRPTRGTHELADALQQPRNDRQNRQAS
ncbi:LysM peptidoglycan-binding domain-containing protein [Amycolatopsis saalfeldensis]|uniref:LysM domain-containing protein n=1 Tax=Amycolatopsis saalfeldensis TaxID=394193 RepID=A0A1H8YNM9_9PSEU|nr:LysM peptidoglycan-binding domain-containing protein [Amycolatopsis saalfeldensis]SEP53804.1 LysM domain-containing protein [Amycolatopsis saalfeldensis]